jgi:hypothetical protein
VLASLAFAVVGGVAVVALGAVLPRWVPRPSEVLDSSTYSRHDPWTTVRVVAVAAAVAFLAAIASHLYLARDTPVRLLKTSMWTLAFRTDCPSGRVPYARVRLSSGTVIVGRVARYSPDIDLQARELMLQPPLFAKAPGRSLSPLPAEWQRLLVRGDAIEMLTVSYRPKPPHPRHDSG